MGSYTPRGFTKHLDKYTKDRRKEAKAVAYDVALRGVEYGATVAERLKIVDRRTYIQRFRAVRTKTGADLQNDAPHAGVIEFGRRPGAKQPPTDVIMRWLRRKGIRSEGLESQRIGRRKKKRGKGLTKGRKRGKRGALRILAFLIARAIGRRGMAPKMVFRRWVYPKLRTWYHAEIRAMLKRKP